MKLGPMGFDEARKGVLVAGAGRLEQLWLRGGRACRWSAHRHHPRDRPADADSSPAMSFGLRPGLNT
jgi:hypothetical protein